MVGKHSRPGLLTQDQDLSLKTKTLAANPRPRLKIGPRGVLKPRPVLEEYIIVFAMEITTLLLRTFKVVKEFSSKNFGQLLHSIW